MYVSLHPVFTAVDNHNNCVYGDASQWSLKYAAQRVVCVYIDLNVHIALCMISPLSSSTIALRP